MRRIINLALIIIVAFSTTSCATLFGGGRSSQLTVESDTPLKIKVQAEEGAIETHTTPFTMELERSQSYTVRIATDGYESNDIFIGKKIRGLAWLNLACLLCWVIDFVTGNAYTHKKHYVYIDTKDLIRKKASAIEQAKDKFIATIYVLLEGRDPDQEEARVKAHREVEFHKV